MMVMVVVSVVAGGGSAGTRWRAVPRWSSIDDDRRWCRCRCGGGRRGISLRWRRHRSRLRRWCWRRSCSWWRGGSYRRRYECFLPAFLGDVAGGGSSGGNFHLTWSRQCLRYQLSGDRLTLFVLFAQLEELVDVVLAQCFQDNDGGSLYAISIMSHKLVCISYLLSKGVAEVDKGPLRS